MVSFRMKRSDRNIFLRVTACLLALCIAAPAWSAVELKLDRDRVMVGETVTLTFVTDDPRQNMEADFSVLEDDFEILDRRTEQQLSIVNGRQTALVRLLLTVEPRRDGDIQIPSFRFGEHVTRPAGLRVDPAPSLAPGELPPVFIEVELEPAEGPYYVHAQLGLVVRVFYQQNLTEAAISQPEPSPASVRLLQETPYQAERGGERYRVLERRYAVFPERSGELVLPPMMLSGRLVERRSSGIWESTDRGRRVRTESEELRLQVEPRPAAFSGDAWQPARALTLAQQISAADELRVGEPVTRTVLIDAVGLEENMIAEPAWPNVADARIYPDQPQGITRDDGRWVLGHKEFRYAVVPEQAGELLLPELEVKWWDTKNDVERVTLLPEQRLTVLPSALVPPAPAIPPSVPAPADSSTAAPGVQAQEGAWKPLAALFTLAWLLTLPVAWWLGRRSAAGTRSAPGNGTDRTPGDAAHSLRAACRAGDARGARRALQRWLAEQGAGHGASILEFAATVDDERLRSCLNELDALGFRSVERDGWDGSSLWAAFDAWRIAGGSGNGNGGAPLTDLYARENRVARGA
jgi:hypothetical protein